MSVCVLPLRSNDVSRMAQTHFCLPFVCYYISVILFFFVFFPFDFRKPSRPKPKAITEKRKNRTKASRWFIDSAHLQGNSWKNGEMEMKVFWCEIVIYGIFFVARKVTVTALLHYCANLIFNIILNVWHLKHSCRASWVSGVLKTPVTNTTVTKCHASNVDVISGHVWTWTELKLTVCPLTVVRSRYNQQIQADPRL